jgi:uncharacterized cupredoxin-like copper-binding protein
MLDRRTTALALSFALPAALAAALAIPHTGRAAPAATFTVVANQTAANGGENYDGVDRGRLAITVPPGTAVDVKFMVAKSAALSHSFQVIALKGSAAAPVLPAQAEPQPVFAGAETPNPTVGTAPGKSVDVRFTASKPGHYLFICGFPGHALLGMYGRFDVVPGAKPSMTK